MLISSEQIAPSQDFLKEGTVRFIFACLRDGNTDDLPPTPLVRKDEKGKLVAIDGHNSLLFERFAARIEVIVAESSVDGLPSQQKQISLATRS